MKRIHVTYHLKAPADQRETVQRVLEFHADYCPAARSIRDAIEITTSVEMEDA